MSRVNPIIFDKLKLEMSRNEVLDQAFLARIDRKWEGAIGERELQYFAPINLLLDHGLDNQKGAVQGSSSSPRFPVSSQAWTNPDI